MPVTVLAVWILGAAGWGTVLAGLRRGLHGRARGPSLLAHGLTPVGVLLLCSVLGFGFLYATIVLAAEWWALALVTGLRPERLLDTGGPGRLAAWAALTSAAVLGAQALVF